MTELTKEQKVYVLKEMIRYYENVKDNIWPMCDVMQGIMVRDLSLEQCEMGFREFENSRPRKKRMDGFWFPITDAKVRLIHCKKILKLIEGK